MHVARAPLGFCLCFSSRANATTDILSTNINSSKQPSKSPRQPWEIWRLQPTLEGLSPSTEMASLFSTCSLGSPATVSTNVLSAMTPAMDTTGTNSERPSHISVWSVVNSCTSTMSKLRIQRICSSPLAPINSNAFT